MMVVDSISQQDCVDKLSQIVERLLETRIVPFIGAGVSFNAHHRKKKTLTNTSYMKQQLAVNICKMRYNETTARQQWWAWCCVASECHEELTKEDCLSRIKNNSDCKLLNNSFDKLCEMNICPDNKASEATLITETLEIQEFANVEPALAHRYIALLAREGLISEIITTNYDTCLETSLLDTFRLKDWKSTSAEESCNEDGPARVIVSLEDYRANAGQSFVDSGRVKTQCLKIYKINGCAKKCFYNGKLAENRILLTERQLQDWGNRAWAQDLFRDRLRSRTLLFSGFGSDEPQVRHTVLQVVEEFSPSAINQTNEQSDWWKQPNAPFIAVHQNSLSFNQTQILQSYAKAHTASPSYNDILRLALTGADASFFYQSNDNDGLDADIFWQRVYQAAFWCLLERYCQSDSAASAFLSAAVHSVKPLFMDMMEWLRPREMPFGSFSKMLDVNEGINGTIPFAVWVWHIRSGQVPASAHWYTPLNRRPILIPIIFLLLYLALAQDNDRSDYKKMSSRIVADNGIFYIKPETSGNSQWFAYGLLIAHVNQAFAGSERIKLREEDAKKPIIQILIGSKPSSSAGKVIVSVEYNTSDRDIKKLGKIPVYKISLLHLFEKTDLASKDAKAIKRDFFDTLLMVPALVDSEQRRFKKHAQRIG